MSVPANGKPTPNSPCQPRAKHPGAHHDSRTGKMWWDHRPDVPFSDEPRPPLGSSVPWGSV